MPDEDTETMNRYDDYTIEELKAALQRIFLYSDLEDQDIEEMEQILAILREKAPFDHPRTAEEMWAEFKAEHAEEFASLGIRENTDIEEVIEKEPVAVKLQAVSEPAVTRPRRARGMLRVAMIAAAMVVFIILATVTASAFGYDLWGWVPKWNDDVMSFSGENNDPNELHNETPIAIALGQLGIDEPLYPHWLPEGFVSTYSVIQTEPLFLHEGYSKGDQFLSITIEPTSLSDTFVFQKDGNPLIEYENHGVTHYVFSDTDQITAAWESGDFSACIVGNISLEEIEKMIDSIYEVIK